MQKGVHLFSKWRKSMCLGFLSVLLELQENHITLIAAKHLGADLIKASFGDSLYIFSANCW